MRKDTPASNSKYYEIDDMYPRSQVQTAPAYVRAPSHLRACNAMAGPSRIPMESASSRCPAPFPVDVRSQEMEGKEVRCLRKLIDGQGISEDAWEGLVRKMHQLQTGIHFDRTEDPRQVLPRPASHLLIRCLGHYFLNSYT